MIRGARLFAALLAIGLVVSARDRVISEKTARKLVREALVAMGDDWSSAPFEPLKDYWAPEFYSFMAYLPGPEINGVSVLQTQYLAVNPWTGDVWDDTECRIITSPVIQKEQEAIWSRSRLPADARLPLHDKSPASCALINGKRTERKYK
jgi:hypothetical protein